MEPLSIFLLWIAGALLLDTPTDTVVLVEDPDGKVGRVVVSNDAGTQVLDAANTKVTLANRTSAPKPPQVVSAKEIATVFGRALDAAPPPPEHFTLYFETGTSTLTAESQARLREIVTSFDNRRLARATITGHTDTVGNADRNYELALRRADAIKVVLVAAGLKSGSVSTRSHGEVDPVVPTADNVSEPENRRVEVTIW